MDEKDGDPRPPKPPASNADSDPDLDGDATRPPQKKKKVGPAPEVGHALRTAYQRTLDENIPPEMLDLLGKLG